MDATALIVYVDEHGQHECSLREASSLPINACHPVRAPKSHRKQPHLPGRYWFAATDEHVLYESRREMRALKMLDFDPDVVEVLAQPFFVVFSEAISKRFGGSKKKPNFHVPDYFARCKKGPDRLVDVKSPEKAEEPEIKRVFDLTREVCRETGWQYAVDTGSDPVVEANVQWLAGFRRQPVYFDEVSEFIREALTEERVGQPVTVESLLAAIEDEVAVALVRPVLFHMLWQWEIATDLHVPLSNASPLYRGKGVAYGR